MEKNFFNVYIYIIVTLLFSFIFISSNDLLFINIFGDRDLIRSNTLLDSFEVYGAEFGMQKGRRIPGGFNYYYLYLLTRITKNVYVLNYISAIITILSPKLLFSSEIAFCIMPSSRNADVPVSSFCEGIPNNITAGIFKSEMFCISFDISDSGNLSMAGIESTGVLSVKPSCTKTGQTKSFVVNLTS